ncbi:malate dehydrogenase, mitochondrial [Tanacetum coccineum]
MGIRYDAREEALIELKAIEQKYHSLKELVNVINNPANSTVSIPFVVFKKAGTYDEIRLFGVTTLDVVRAKTFYAGKAKVGDAGIIGGSITVNVLVVGGHVGITILPFWTSKSLAAAIGLTVETLQRRVNFWISKVLKAVNQTQAVKVDQEVSTNGYVGLLFVKGTGNPTQIVSNLNELVGYEQNEEIQVYGSVCRLCSFSTSVMVLCSLTL